MRVLCLCVCVHVYVCACVNLCVSVSVCIHQMLRMYVHEVTTVNAVLTSTNQLN